eukprot:SAG31_NODE_3901_length_3770_cov_4.494416_3_plen_129_part_00
MLTGAALQALVRDCETCRAMALLHERRLIDSTVIRKTPDQILAELELTPRSSDAQKRAYRVLTDGTQRERLACGMILTTDERPLGSGHELRIKKTGGWPNKINKSGGPSKPVIDFWVDQINVGPYTMP